MSPQDTFARWYEVQSQLQALKAEELELREQLAEMYFSDAPAEGTTAMDLDGGWQLKCKKTVSRRLSNAKGETTQIVSQLPPEVAEAAVGWKPELRLRGYRKLAPEHKALLDTVLTSKPGRPVLDLVPPKEDS